MITFDDVLPALLRTAHASQTLAQLEKVGVVRDLRGRIRLAVRPLAGADPALDALENGLRAELGEYFSGPILSSQGKREAARLAQNILDQCTAWPAGWPTAYSDTLLGTTKELERQVWGGMQRLLSKQSWLGGAEPTGLPPWPLLSTTPGIVSFYSFKGGVGRTTVLSAVAFHATRAAKRVVAVDLDLEAPGLGSLFGIETRRGVLDLVVDHLATGKLDLTDAHMPVPELGGLTVFPAGKINWAFLEKLGRLDFVESGTGQPRSPMDAALRALLGAIRSELEPDLILLDSRSGLHDLGGLSLHGLSHLDVLAARANAQAYAGLDLTLQALVRRHSEQTLRLLLVHTFAPVDRAQREREVEEFRGAAYDSFSRHLYSSDRWADADAPTEDATDAPHLPWVVSENAGLARLSRFSDIADSVWHDRELSSLWGRVAELLSAEEDSDTEGDDE